MKKLLMLIVGAVLMGGAAAAQKPPLLPEETVAALASELEGETAKRNLEEITRFHRQRGSQGFHAAAEIVVSRLREYGLADAAILQFPADGTIFYGTQRSRPPWDAQIGDLDETTADGGTKRISSFEAEPVSLAEDSESADVITDLTDVGAGTSESDYAGKSVKGKIVLVRAQPGAVQDLAIGKFGAVGIVSSAQNQHTAWSGDNRDQIRWGHLDTFSPNKTFAFMVSLATAATLKDRLAKGESIKLHAVVRAGQHPGHYEVVTATIPGSDPGRQDEEIAFSCHLDHQRPGANDNASGCVTILEVARTLEKLIAQNKLARPARTIRFIFPPEIEGTLALLEGQPEFARRIKAVIHMDMVGGGPETQSVFHVTRGPMSLPSFVHDVAWSFAQWINEQSYKFAATGKAEYPLISPGGGKGPLRAEYVAYTMGSDHDVYQDSSFAIPSIYMNDWPDRYIHTNLDTPANIDATKLKRVALIGAASAYVLAQLSPQNAPPVEEVLRRGAVWRDAEAYTRRPADLGEAACEHLYALQYEEGCQRSLERFLSGSQKSTDQKSTEKLRVKSRACPVDDRSEIPGAEVRFARVSEPRGPMAVFGYDYLVREREKKGLPRPGLLEYEGPYGSGEEYAYEVLNFADGTRTAREIRDAVSAEYGAIPSEPVLDYLRALAEAGLVKAEK